MFFALTTVSALTGDSLGKGMSWTFLGLGLATIGLDVQTGTARFTIGIDELQGGISFLVVVVGIFAIADVTRMVEDQLKGTLQVVRIKGSIWFTREEAMRALPAVFRGWCVGFFCGSAPGLGGTIAAMLSYVLEKLSKHPEEFGHGAVEGVAAAGSGCERRCLRRLCSSSGWYSRLGCHRSDHGRLSIMYGIQPGPMLFHQQPELVWGLIASMYVGNVMLLVLSCHWSDCLRASWTFLPAFCSS